MSYFKAIWHKMLIQRSRPDKQMTLSDGGRTIALVGVDGAGKSTLAKKLVKWLSWKIDTPFYYLGSKQPSVWTTWSYLFFRMMRRGHRELSAKWGENNFIVKALLNLRQIFLALHYLFVGYDRVGRYRLGKRQAGQGSVVVFDRFPFVAPLDGPEIHLIDGGYHNGIVRRLSQIETKLYRQFDSVDLLIVLNVSMEVSLQRKADHSPDTIRKKNIALTALKTQLEQDTHWNWVSVDADAPFEDVFLQAKREVWAAL